MCVSIGELLPIGYPEAALTHWGSIRVDAPTDSYICQECRHLVPSGIRHFCQGKSDAQKMAEAIESSEPLPPLSTLQRQLHKSVERFAALLDNLGRLIAALECALPPTQRDSVEPDPLPAGRVWVDNREGDVPKWACVNDPVRTSTYVCPPDWHETRTDQLCPALEPWRGSGHETR
jgi:hypothetical protein